MFPLLNPHGLEGTIVEVVEFYTILLSYLSMNVCVCAWLLSHYLTASLSAVPVLANLPFISNFGEGDSGIVCTLLIFWIRSARRGKTEESYRKNKAEVSNKIRS